MNRDQINKTNMYQATNLILGTNRAIWESTPAFARGQQALEGSINTLAALAQQQGEPITGIAMEKERPGLSLARRALVVAGAGAAHAFESGDQTLGAKFEVTESALKALRDSLLDEAAQSIHDTAAALADANLALCRRNNWTNSGRHAAGWAWLDQHRSNSLPTPTPSFPIGPKPTEHPSRSSMRSLASLTTWKWSKTTSARGRWDLKFPRFRGQAGRRTFRKDCKHAENTRELRQGLPSGSRQPAARQRTPAQAGGR